jgi:hypothetical protein
MKKNRSGKLESPIKSMAAIMIMIVMKSRMMKFKFKSTNSKKKPMSIKNVLAKRRALVMTFWEKSLRAFFINHFMF